MELGWEILPHFMYSPALSPSDFHLFHSKQLRFMVSTSFQGGEKFLEEFIESEPQSFFL